MKVKLLEIFAALAVIFVLAGTPYAVNKYSPWNNYSGKKIISLTAVAAQGIWTEEKVDGLNYWYKDFKKATLILIKDEEIILRLTSVDVTHTFYLPELDLGPVIVEAGKFYDVKFKPSKTGKFTYYCTTVCGHCHFYMQGKVLVVNNSDYNNTVLINELLKDTIRPVCTNHLSKPETASSFIEKGQTLFKLKNCFTCHGEKGKGGIYNPNYAKYYIPQLNNLASKLKISSKEDADIIIKLLEKNTDFELLEDDPPVENYSRFFAQYTSIIKKINDGAPKLQKSDSTLFEPPLLMPSWENNLSEDEIKSIIAYLINLNNWDDE